MFHTARPNLDQQHFKSSQEAMATILDSTSVGTGVEVGRLVGGHRLSGESCGRLWAPRPGASPGEAHRKDLE